MAYIALLRHEHRLVDLDKDVFTKLVEAKK
jgi:hypothetical protein